MNKIIMKKKIVCTPPPPSLPAAVPLISNTPSTTHTLKYAHKQLRSICISFFLSIILFHVRWLTCCINAKKKKKWSGVGKKRQNGWDLRKESRQRNEWIREKKSQMHGEGEQDREKQREMKRAGVLFIQLPLYWSSLQKRERKKRNKKGGCALSNHSLRLNAFNSLIPILVYKSFFYSS